MAWDLKTTCLVAASEAYPETAALSSQVLVAKPSRKEAINGDS